MPEETDAALVGMVRERGDTEAYGQLIKRYQGHAYGLAYSILGDWAQAQDMAQEAFIRAYVNLHTLKEPARFAAWLRRIVFSTCMTWLHTFRPELYRSMGAGEATGELDDVPDTDADTPIEHTLKREMSEVVLSAIADLPQKYRIPLTMFHLDGLSYKRVADFLEIPIGTVKSLISRARKRLKPALEAYAREALPTVNEVLIGHKPTEEFAEKTMERLKHYIVSRHDGCRPDFAQRLNLSVTELQGTSPEINIGDKYIVRGHYQLSGEDTVSLGAIVSGKSVGHFVDLEPGSGQFAVWTEILEMAAKGDRRNLGLMVGTIDDRECGDVHTAIQIAEGMEKLEDYAVHHLDTCRTDFREGLKLRVRELLGTSRAIRAGEKYLVRGSYELSGEEPLSLRPVVSGKGRGQFVDLTPGSGEFSLWMEILVLSEDARGIGLMVGTTGSPESGEVHTSIRFAPSSTPAPE